MCVAIPGKVIEIYEGESLIDFGKIKKRVNTFFIDNIQLGDYVLIHAGCAIEKVSEEEAIETMDIFKSISEEL
ncbi:MAG: HypC/HybG/HupF family hydrogenase formation chaperone [Terrisporobacter othiniensis]|uniref:HypC/HybG/HupF family hydrogenase formation chaperone n=1 Tax=Terrisporobacter petrolearius TaxID=1460447 RepID=UPI0022E8E6C6|nr:HypC/HybG/HupF family hydrogenase formation chaperone [Terrisporobacter petrolearius]MDU4861672.1 HypC/HybG/HupF family hydrogenase formation chaperone [Terrisporobacter othiniensis]MDU6995325.1 HypC/HybG/HupF family hydrogenase formation chaperone [Terrisporobacter othiniensis]